MCCFAPSRLAPYAIGRRFLAVPCESEVTQEPGLPQRTRSGATLEKAVEAFRAILIEISGRIPTTPGALLQLEEQLHSRIARECIDPFVASVLKEALSHPAVSRRAEAYIRSVPALWLQKKSETVRVTLLGGTAISIETPYYLRRPHKNKNRRGRKRQKGSRMKTGNGCYPYLLVLGIRERVTPALVCEVSRLAALGTYKEASATLAVRGITLDPKQVSSLSRSLAQRGLSYREWCLARTQSGYCGSGIVRGKRLVIGVDGGRIRVREPNVRGRRRKSGGRGVNPAWREPKIFIIYEIDKLGRKIRRGFVRQDATLDDADGLFRLLTSALQLIGAHEALEWVIIGDGAEWIWNRFPQLVADVGFDAGRVTQVVDFYHAVEHLTGISEYVKGAGQRKDWFRKAKKLLKRGQTTEVRAMIEQLCRGRNAKKIRKGLKYFDDHAHRMDYDDFRHRRVPQGSGAVESCIRRVVNLRLKGNSIYWGRESGEGMLHSRAQLLSSQWAAFVAAALEPECFWTVGRKAA